MVWCATGPGNESGLNRVAVQWITHRETDATRMVDNREPAPFTVGPFTEESEL